MPNVCDFGSSKLAGAGGLDSYSTLYTSRALDWGWRLSQAPREKAFGQRFSSVKNLAWQVRGDRLSSLSKHHVFLQYQWSRTIATAKGGFKNGLTRKLLHGIGRWDWSGDKSLLFLTTQCPWPPPNRCIFQLLGCHYRSLQVKTFDSHPILATPRFSTTWSPWMPHDRPSQWLNPS